MEHIPKYTSDHRSRHKHTESDKEWRDEELGRSSAKRAKGDKYRLEELAYSPSTKSRTTGSGKPSIAKGASKLDKNSSFKGKSVFSVKAFCMFVSV